MSPWLRRLVPTPLRRYGCFLTRLLLITSALTIFLQNLMLGQVTKQGGTHQNQRRYFIYPKSKLSLENESLPEYAKRLSVREDPDVSPDVAYYKQFGKATVIAKFKSSFPRYRNVTLNNHNIRIFKHPRVFDTTFNGNITTHHINRDAYFRSSPKYLYILSAFLRDKSAFRLSSKSASQRARFYSFMDEAGDEHVPDNEHVPKSGRTHVDEVVLTGWIQELATNASILCCFLRDNFTVIMYPNMKRLIWTQVKKQELIAGKVFCPIPGDVARSSLQGVALSMPTERCRKQTFLHMETAAPAGRDSVGVCAKIVYGGLAADRLVEWLEVQRHLEVDRVLLYVYNLNEQAVRVVRHYTLAGFVQMIPFDYPMAAELKRFVGQKEALAYIDEQVVVFDCMERMRGFAHVTIMDVDEILYAKAAHNNSIKALVKKLLNFYPDAAGFTFKTELFITDWPTDGQADSNLFWHTRYQNRTRQLVDRPKNLLVLDRVVLGSVWTHNFTTKAGFDRYMVPSNLAVVKHYRPCRANWGCHQRKGYIDKSIVKIIETIKDTIYRQFERLNVTRSLE